MEFEVLDKNLVPLVNSFYLSPDDTLDKIVNVEEN